MNRLRINLEDIALRENLQRALWLAARGKRDRPVIGEWLGNSEIHIQQLQASILNETAPVGRFRQFTIHDPKQRVIHAAEFSDRVLHHAVMSLAGPELERSLVADSYACVQGRGVHAAAFRVQDLLRRYPWFVKVDVKGYFPSIEHAVLLNLLSRRFKGKELLSLLARIVAANGGTPGRGLPIGSLCSQHFANLYLDGADRLISEELNLPGRVRYMDDLLWWAPCRTSAHESLRAVTEWLQENRKLRLHNNSIVNRSEHGVSFCGYRITRQAIRLSVRRKRRYVEARRQLEQQWKHGGISDADLQQGYAAIKAITLPADSVGFRRENLVQHAPPVA